MRKAIFLDRDGVINKLVSRDGGWYSPRNTADFVLEDGICEFASSVKAIGFEIVIVTNQPDISRGFLDWRTLSEMHQLVKERLEVLDILVCPHQELDNCLCRKPKPGMIDHALKKHEIDRHQSFLVGDQERDLVAARVSGVTPIGIQLRSNTIGMSFSDAAVVCSSFAEVLATINPS
jgi:D-glycero-D-manno-heptose 1,7-bisphosphate phosphatase